MKSGRFLLSYSLFKGRRANMKIVIYIIYFSVKIMFFLQNVLVQLVTVLGVWSRYNLKRKKCHKTYYSKCKFLKTKNLQFLGT